MKKVREREREIKKQKQIICKENTTTQHNTQHNTTQHNTTQRTNKSSICGINAGPTA